MTSQQRHSASIQGVVSHGALRDSSNEHYEDSSTSSSTTGSSSNGLSTTTASVVHAVAASATADLFDDADGGASLFETEDQHANFVPLEPPLADEDYLFSLDMGEGISDLFDAYDLTF